MVTWHTARGLRSLLLVLAWLGTACGSTRGPSADASPWQDRAAVVKNGAERGAEVVGESLGTAYRGAEAVGESLGTAYRGARDGFEEPSADSYGPYPKDYAKVIRQHMLRFEGVPGDASFHFDRPEKGYLNDGILTGGRVEWQGWVVDMKIETKTFAGQRRTKAYLVRMSNGEVVDVQDAAYATTLRRAAPAAPAK